MNTKTFSYCMKCQSLNKISVDKVQSQAPVCGKCATPLSMHALVTNVDEAGLTKMIRKSDVPVLVDFWAPWCSPCRSFAPTFEAASKHYAGKITFIKINTQDFPNSAQQFNIRGIPSLLLFKKGQESARESGAFPLEQLKSWLTSKNL